MKDSFDDLFDDDLFYTDEELKKKTFNTRRSHIQSSRMSISENRENLRKKAIAQFADEKKLAEMIEGLKKYHKENPGIAKEIHARQDVMENHHNAMKDIWKRPEHRKKIQKPVMIEGKRFESVKEGAAYLGIKPQSLIYRLKTKPEQYYYIENNKNEKGDI